MRLFVCVPSILKLRSAYDINPYSGQMLFFHPKFGIKVKTQFQEGYLFSTMNAWILPWI